MMFKTVLCFTTLYLSSVALAQTACIVGAGPAGLTVAKGLEAKNYTTVIFDKNPQVGGKCQSYYDEKGIYHPMGALLFANETYTQTLPIIDASGVLSTPFSYDIPLVLYHDNGFTLQSPLTLSSLTKQPKFAAEIVKYNQLWNETFAPTMAIGYTKGVGNFTMSTFDWLKANDLPLLLSLFLNGMIPYGYGDVRETPILYTLTYMTPDILKFFSGQEDGYVVDFQKVFIEYAKKIKGKIYLSSTITSIDRSGTSPIVTYLTKGSTTPAKQSCDKLVLAFPPVVRALQDAHLKVSPTENATFFPIGITKYWSGAVSMVTPDATAFAGFLSAKYIGLLFKSVSVGGVTFDEYKSALPDATGEPVAFVRLFNGSSVATTWSWGKYRSEQTLAQGRGLLKTVLSKVNKPHPANNLSPAKPITEADIKEFKEWDYFPHYDQPDLDAGIYNKFNNLQGQQNTFYASGLNGFETVEFAIRAGNDIVERITNSTSPTAA